MINSFNKNDIEFINKLFFNCKELKDVIINISKVITKPNLNLKVIIPEITVSWKVNCGDIINHISYIKFYFKENTQFAFESEITTLNGKLDYYSSERDVDSYSESGYNIQCFNYLEDCLNEIGINEIDGAKLLAFIIRIPSNKIDYYKSDER